MRLLAVLMAAIPGAALAHENGAPHLHGYETAAALILICLAAGWFVWAKSKHRADKD